MRREQLLVVLGWCWGRIQPGWWPQIKLRVERRASRDPADAQAEQLIRGRQLARELEMTKRRVRVKMHLAEMAIWEGNLYGIAGG